MNYANDNETSSYFIQNMSYYFASNITVQYDWDKKIVDTEIEPSFMLTETLGKSSATSSSASVGIPACRLG